MARTTRTQKEQVRITVAVDPALRRHIRIAAAYADMEVGEWSAKVLKEAAEKAVGADRGGR